MSMASSISNLIDNVPEGNHRVICRHRHDNKNCETFGIKYNYCECCLEYVNVKGYLYYTKVCLVIGVTKNILRKIQRGDLLIHTSFLTSRLKIFFRCCKMIFTHTNTWANGKNSMKRDWRRKKIFTVT